MKNKIKKINPGLANKDYKFGLQTGQHGQTGQTVQTGWTGQTRQTGETGQTGQAGQIGVDVQTRGLEFMDRDPWAGTHGLGPSGWEWDLGLQTGQTVQT